MGKPFFPPSGKNLKYGSKHACMNHHVKCRPGRPRKHWIDTKCQDLKTIGIIAWEEAEESAANREDWHRSVAQCVCDTG